MGRTFFGAVLLAIRKAFKKLLFRKGICNIEGKSTERQTENSACRFLTDKFTLKNFM